MFDEQAFHSWPYVFAGAVLFALLFVVAGLMIELVFDGAFRVTRSVVGLGAGAFVGYVAVASILRRMPSDGA